MRGCDATGGTAGLLPNPSTFRALSTGIEGIPAMTTGTNPNGFGAWTVAAFGTGNAGDPLRFLRIEL